VKKRKGEEFLTEHMPSEHQGSCSKKNGKKSGLEKNKRKRRHSKKEKWLKKKGRLDGGNRTSAHGIPKKNIVLKKKVGLQSSREGCFHLRDSTE